MTEVGADMAIGFVQTSRSRQLQKPDRDVSSVRHSYFAPSGLANSFRLDPRVACFALTLGYVISRFQREDIYGRATPAAAQTSEADASRDPRPSRALVPTYPDHAQSRLRLPATDDRW